MVGCDCPAHGLAASRRFLCAQDVDIIHRLASEMPDLPATVIDCGAGSGTTALAVLEKRLTDVIVFSVDTDQNALNWAALAVKNVGRVPHWNGINLSVERAAEAYTGAPPALFLHDAGHTRAAIDRDLRAWLPKLRSGTPVWVHDVGVAPDCDDPPAETYPGVLRALRRLEKEGLLEIIEFAGWGAVCRKP